MKENFKTVAILIGSVVMAIAVLYIIGALSFLSPERIAQHAIYNYEYFHEEYASYETMRLRLLSLEADTTEQAAFEARAVRNQILDLAARYNARSRMVHRSTFKAGDLPQTLSTNWMKP